MSMLLIGLFISSGYIMPVGDQLFSQLYPKPKSSAAPIENNTPYPLGDINQDCIVDQLDVTYFYNLINGEVDNLQINTIDINRDGIVDIFDLGIISEHIGEECNAYSLEPGSIQCSGGIADGLQLKLSGSELYG